jgi:hypothetical protein
LVGISVGQNVHVRQCNDEDVRDIQEAAARPSHRLSDVGPVLLNGDGDVEGEVWKEMPSWMLDVGITSFPSQLSWKQQSPDLKMEF